MVTPLSERLRTDAKPDSFTLAKARALGWKVTRRAATTIDPADEKRWRVKRDMADAGCREWWFPTCEAALRWIRGLSERAVRS